MARERIVAVIEGPQADHRIESPRYTSRAGAEAELQTIREAVARPRPRMIELPWLAVVEQKIVAAWIEEAQEGSAPRAAPSRRRSSGSSNGEETRAPSGAVTAAIQSDPAPEVRV